MRLVSDAVDRVLHVLVRELVPRDRRHDQKLGGVINVDALPKDLRSILVGDGVRDGLVGVGCDLAAAGVDVGGEAAQPYADA